KTGKETLVENWIIHKLNKATIEMNKFLGEKNLMNATTSVYNFWLYELCDIYIELIKPMTDVDTSIPKNAELKRSAQDTLYTCLEAGLKLLHPFMPFVTEELYQRLPRRPGDDTLTIVRAKYPLEVPEYSNPKAEEQFDLVFNVVKVARSLIVQHNIQSDATLFIQTASEPITSLLNSEDKSIKTLVKNTKSIQVIGKDGALPSEYASSIVNEEISVLLLLDK
ncbi:14667_t:CDS:2, partial [Entrophospora sp. SA101]